MTLAFSARLQAVRGQLGAVIGLSGTQYTVLIAIAHLSGTDEKIGVNQVAEHLHFSGAFITIEINKLVSNGLVEKETDEEDRRRVILTITPKARALLNELAPVQRPVNDMLFRSMSAAGFRANAQADVGDGGRRRRGDPAAGLQRTGIGRPADQITCCLTGLSLAILRRAAGSRYPFRSGRIAGAPDRARSFDAAGGHKRADIVRR